VVIRSGACCRVRRLAKNCGASGGLPRPSYDRALWALRTWLDSWSGIGRIAVGMAHQGFALQLTRYARLAGDVLHDRDGTLADERDGNRLEPHAVARHAAGGMGGARARERLTTLRNLLARLTRGTRFWRRTECVLYRIVRDGSQE
jgi:hypothetical protein